VTGLTTPTAAPHPPSRLLLAIGFLVMLLTPFACYFLAGLSLPERDVVQQKELQQEVQHKARELAQETALETAIFPMKPLLINIAETRGTRMLKLTPYLQFKEAGMSAKLAPILPLLTDCIATVTSGKTLDDLDGPAGRETLKTNLVEQLNKLLAQQQIAPVTDLYFEEFLIQ
jgi:flagellar FliL protein